MAIEAVAIGINRYAPAGSDAINVYKTSFGGEEQEYAFGKLLVAINLQAAANCELRSVTYMNRISVNSSLLNLMSAVANRINNDDHVTWDDKIADSDIPSDYKFRSAEFASSHKIGDFFKKELEISSDILPDKLSDGDDEGFTRRLQAFSALKDKMDAANRVSQQLQIGLRTQVSRRDVSYSTSSNLLKNMVGSMMTEAQVLRI